MNTLNNTFRHLLFVPVIPLLTLSAFGQNEGMGKIHYNTGDPTTWPKEEDAVISAPEHHKVLMENDEVRVLEVTLAPGAVEPVHHHRWPSVLYITEAGDFIDRDGEGNVIMDTREMPAPLVFPLTMWKDPEAPHSVENLSTTTTIRLIRMELKK